jgi:hypothetical protein
VAWRSKFDHVVSQVRQQLPYSQKVLLLHAHTQHAVRRCF